MRGMLKNSTFRFPHPWPEELDESQRPVFTLIVPRLATVRRIRELIAELDGLEQPAPLAPDASPAQRLAYRDAVDRAERQMVKLYDEMEAIVNAHVVDWERVWTIRGEPMDYRDDAVAEAVDEVGIITLARAIEQGATMNYLEKKASASPSPSLTAASAPGAPPDARPDGAEETPKSSAPDATGPADGMTKTGNTTSASIVKAAGGSTPASAQ